MIEQFGDYPATFALIGINGLISLYAFSSPAFMAAHILHIGALVRYRQYYRLLSSGFVHAGLLHLAVNLFVLASFGPVVETIIGPVRLLIVYVAALIGGSYWTFLHNRMNADYKAVGASGAISGIVLSVCVFFPLSVVSVFFIPMPAIVFAVLFLLGSAILAQRENRIIGHEAHLGGAVSGLAATVIVEPDAVGLFLDQMAGGFSGTPL